MYRIVPNIRDLTSIENKKYDIGNCYLCGIRTDKLNF